MTDIKRSMIDMVLRQFLKVTQPHLSKIIGSNRLTPGPWKEDPRPRPPRLSSLPHYHSLLSSLTLFSQDEHLMQ